MKKLIIAITSIALSVSTLTAQENAGYNRIGLSYNNTHFGFDKFGDDLDIDGTSLNGIGIDYIHGFSLSRAIPIFLETGLNLNFNFGSENLESIREGNYWAKSNLSMQNINAQVPVNFVYRFNLANDLSIAPYLGLNFKLHFTEKIKTEITTNIPDRYLIQAGIDPEELEGEWTSLFDEDLMGGEKYTWNRFQMGWHIGVGFRYKPLYLGVQYGTDFISAYSYKDSSVNTGNLKISLAYSF